MLRQYLEMKSQAQDAILFYRIGYFYEMFFEDSRDFFLSSRRRHTRSLRDWSSDVCSSDLAGGVPLVAELTYGAGKVVELAYDPSGDGTGQTPYAALGWTQALGRSIEQVPGSTPMASSMLGPDPGFTALLPSAGDAPLPPLWLVGVVLLAYVLIAGPLGYLLARRRLGRPALFWAAVPLSAAFFTAAFYLVGSALQGNLQDHEIQVVRVGPGQSVNVLEYHRVLFLHRGEHEILPAPDSLVAPLTLETFRVTGSTCERCTSVLGGLSSGAEHVG